MATTDTNIDRIHKELLQLGSLEFQFHFRKSLVYYHFLVDNKMKATLSKAKILLRSDAAQLQGASDNHSPTTLF